MATRIQNLGGKLAYVAMDEPLYFGHYAAVTAPSGKSCGFSIPALAANASATMAQYRSYFPAISAGDVEPSFQLPGDGWANDLASFIDTYAAVDGAPFAFFHEDAIFADPRWVSRIHALQTLLSDRSVAYGVIWNGTGNSSDQTWTTAARAHIQTYRAMGLPTPTQNMFQSWDPFPKALLPETSDGTITSLINFYFSDPLGSKTGPVPVYRFQMANSAYLYTASASDISPLQAAGNKLDGAVGYVYPTADSAAGLSPVYRLWNKANNDRMLSVSGDEIAAAAAIGYVNEGLFGFAFGPTDPHGIPFNNSVSSKGIHFSSESQAEAQSVGPLEGTRMSLIPF